MWHRKDTKLRFPDGERKPPRRGLTKVPAVTLGFWVIKILATTLGETGGDIVSMSWLGAATPETAQSTLNGYLVGNGIFGIALIVLVWAWREDCNSADPLHQPQWRWSS
jgi:hypothetical protein